MKKLLLLIPIVAVLTACGTTSDPYERRANAERERQEKYVERTIDKAPKWMLETPISNSAVYAAGTSASGDYSFAFQKAKADAYGKICMAAGGTASQRTKVYKTDSADSSSEMSEMVLRTQCKEVDLTGVEIKERKIISEGNRFRAYVLVALPTGDANVLRKAKDQRKLQEQMAKRAPEAFKELD
jgi:hypothetical protein